MHPLRSLDQRLNHLAGAEILALTVCGVLIVGWIDYITGYEVSLSLLYLAPVSVAAWYSGRRMGIAIAILCSVTWYVADVAAGAKYSLPAIHVWNALVRLGFFLVSALLLAMLRNNFRREQQLARIDSLTGLYCRREFEDILEHDLALAKRNTSSLTLAYVDVDDFKTINDTHGHSEGDHVLRVIGSALKDSVREADTAARVGGDEFALILPDTDSQGAREVMSKLTRELHKALRTSDCEVTCSIGVVTFLNSATSPERAVAAADELMYQVKHQGKGAVAFSVLGEAAQPGGPPALRDKAAQRR
jgi:diguanylate cyclase (GGDEF)-like protein